MTLQKKATIVSSSVAALLTLMKFSVGLASGSVAVLASAVDSILDMFVSLFNYFAISKSEKPADETFNYGRGKIEALASVIEGSVIAISGIFLFYQAIKKAIYGEESTYLELSLYIMMASLIITIALVIYLNYVAKKTGSMVVKADALHYKTDIYSNGAVLISVFIVFMTGYEFADVLVGGAIALFIIYSAYELIKEGVLVLLDRALEDEIVSNIKIAIESESVVNDYHYLKTRQAGQDIFVDVHLVFDCLISLMDAHRASDRIEEQIRKLDTNKNWVINMHLDPYDDSIINDTQTIYNKGE
ncbi:cation diffusion facilitator family transporter [Arcobacter sp. FWKO B]|uniref:cation diffusion facilitator family transporter n=1 Tax=Arcobacter sp. FWKO B TaxID=2593672 RepID=UPI0019088303|nr:cation diffusion facilitator family transporter [Arcobacter sp. FWKO B]